MQAIEVTKDKRNEYNFVVSHPLQSYEWGEFREKTGVKVVRRAFIVDEKIVDGFTLTIHKVPKTKFTIGYLPKGKAPTQELLSELKKIGRENNCIFIQLEPNVTSDTKPIGRKELFPSFHPLFTKYTFVLDISPSEDELLKKFHPKTRYNIKVAQKHNVTVTEEISESAFKEYLRLTEETTRRQQFFAHTPSYHKLMWETLGKKTNGLSAHLLTATYKPEGQKKETLASWILFVFKDYLYYPYGASSSKHRNVMASNLIMWEAIKLGKKLGLSYFDMWGALGENPDSKDPWYGFHKFKEGYGATHTEFVGSFDLVINPIMYQLYKIADKGRWAFLRVKKRLK